MLKTNTALQAVIALCLLSAPMAACAPQVDDLYDADPRLKYGAHKDYRAANMAGNTGSSGDAEDQRALQGLAEVLEYQLEHAPSIKAARQRYRAEVEAVPAATRLPNLMVQYTWLPEPVETRTGPNEHRIMLQQAVPFPTKLAARDSIARASARKAAIQYDKAVRDAVTELRVAYADLYYYQRALEVLENNKELARSLSQLAATHHSEGSGVLADVARAQAQLAQLDYDRITLEERAAVARARVNGLLGRPAEAPLAVEPLPRQELGVGEEDLVQLAYEHRQELAILDEGIQQLEAGHDLAASSWAPDLVFGAQLMLQGESPIRPEPPDSGEEAVAVTFGLSLPVWAWANAAEEKSAEARLIAALYDKQAALATVEPDVRDALFKERNAGRLITLYDEELLPHAISALETAEQLGQSDAGNVAELLEARATYYSFALARERALADHFQSVARLEQVIGASLLPLEKPAENEDRSSGGSTPSHGADDGGQP